MLTTQLLLADNLNYIQDEMLEVIHNDILYQLFAISKYESVVTISPIYRQSFSLYEQMNDILPEEQYWYMKQRSVKFRYQELLVKVMNAITQKEQ